MFSLKKQKKRKEGKKGSIQEWRLVGREKA
jgi:hypothetical protein